MWVVRGHEASHSIFFSTVSCAFRFCSSDSHAFTSTCCACQITRVKNGSQVRAKIHDLMSCHDSDPTPGRTKFGFADMGANNRSFEHACLWLVRCACALPSCGGDELAHCTHQLSCTSAGEICNIGCSRAKGRNARACRNCAQPATGA